MMAVVGAAGRPLRLCSNKCFVLINKAWLMMHVRSLALSLCRRIPSSTNRFQRFNKKENNHSYNSFENSTILSQRQCSLCSLLLIDAVD